MVAAATLPWALQCLASSTPNKMTELLQKIVSDGTAPGASIIVSRNGAIRFKESIGTCCQISDRQARLKQDTLHPLYSFSKLITGTVVGIAKQEGRLDYGDLVSRHIPEFKGGGKDGITIRHCLTHSAGLNKVDSKQADTQAGWEDALRMLCAADVAWEPGSRTAYHGWSGAFLAAECVRRTHGGKPWDEICHEKLFGPIGAKSLSYAMPKAASHVAIVPQPKPEKPLPLTPQAAFSYAGQPGAGCFGTLADALKVLHLHLQNGVWKSKTLISRNILEEIHTVQCAKEITAAREAGKSPRHEPWGLGPLLRGPGAACEGHKWFGFYNQTSSGIFGHAGIDTLIGVADPATGIALVFATTHSPKDSATTITLRNSVTDLVLGGMFS